MNEQLAEQLVTAVVAGEALGALFVAIWLAYRLVRPRRRRPIRTCEKGTHRCMSCDLEEVINRSFYTPAELEEERIDAIFEPPIEEEIR